MTGVGGEGSAVTPDGIEERTRAERRFRNPGYTRYHPKWYRRRMPIFWWVRKTAYLKFIVRELTALGVAYGALLLLAWTWAVAQGPEAYAAFVEWLAGPWVLGLHLVVLLALLFHTLTWLNLAPTALVMKVKGRRLSNRTVVALHYLLWAAVSAVVVWVVVAWSPGGLV